VSRRARPVVEVHWTVGGRRPLTGRECGQLVGAALAHAGRSGGRISLVFVGDRELARLHAECLGDASRTDVITFDLSTPGGEVEGELYVSVERARAVARAERLRIRHELALYVVHGCLHLVGFDDRAPAARRRMIAAERAVLAPLGLAHAVART